MEGRKCEGKGGKKEQLITVMNQWKLFYASVLWQCNERSRALIELTTPQRARVRVVDSVAGARDSKREELRNSIEPWLIMNILT